MYLRPPLIGVSQSSFELFSNQLNPLLRPPHMRCRCTVHHPPEYNMKYNELIIMANLQQNMIQLISTSNLFSFITLMQIFIGAYSTIVQIYLSLRLITS